MPHCSVLIFGVCVFEVLFHWYVMEDTTKHVCVFEVWFHWYVMDDTAKHAFETDDDSLIAKCFSSIKILQLSASWREMFHFVVNWK